MITEPVPVPYQDTPKPRRSHQSARSLKPWGVLRGPGAHGSGGCALPIPLPAWTAVRDAGWSTLGPQGQEHIRLVPRSVQPGPLWVRTTLSQPLTWCLLLGQGRSSSASCCARTTRSGTVGTRATAVRLSGSAPRLRLDCLARPLRPRQGRRDPHPAPPGHRPPAPGQNSEAVLG